MTALARHCELRVVAPIPGFPPTGSIRDRGTSAWRLVEAGGPFPVYHPRVLSIPRYLQCVDGILCTQPRWCCFMSRLRRDFPFDPHRRALCSTLDGLAAVLLGEAAAGVRSWSRLRGSIVRLQHYRLHRPRFAGPSTSAARVIAVSQSPEADVATDLGVGGAAHLPSSPTEWTSRSSVRRSGAPPGSMRAAADRPIILTVGGIYEGKGQHHVVEALARLSARRPDAVYVMVGRGPSRRLRGRFARTRRACRPRRAGALRGRKPHDALADWYSAADVFCLATRSEGWANVLLEALACGTARGRHEGRRERAEIVPSDRYGLLVAHGDVPALADALDRAIESRWDRTASVPPMRRAIPGTPPRASSWASSNVFWRPRPASFSPSPRHSTVEREVMITAIWRKRLYRLEALRLIAPRPPGWRGPVHATSAHLEAAADLDCPRPGCDRRSWGVRGYSFEDGWIASYPETTGYIIPTLLAYA